MTPGETAPAPRHGFQLARADYERIRQLVDLECGIQLSAAKRVMVESRLRKRVNALGLHSFHAYCEYLFGKEGRQHELVPMIDVITTNKTDFFREAAHFDFLVEVALPSLERSLGTGMRHPCAVWSAGCSTGEEPYTLAMVLTEYANRHGKDWKFSIFASDISTRVLEKAHAGIYDEDCIQPVPMEMRRKYLLRSRNAAKHSVRIVPALRAKVRFMRLNFLDREFPVAENFDVIFCRNVIIYFDRRTQERVVGNIVRRLKAGGYLFMGHSETLNGFDLPLTPVGATVYQRNT